MRSKPSPPSFAREHCRSWALPRRLRGLGGTTRYAINPACDLGPRIAVLPITGTRNSDWGYASVPVIGPLVGASLAGLLCST